MAKSTLRDRALPENLDLVFSTFIEVTGLITTGASLPRIVSPLLNCAREILSGKAAFMAIDVGRGKTMVCYGQASRRGRQVVKNQEIATSTLKPRRGATLRSARLTTLGKVINLKRIGWFRGYSATQPVVAAKLRSTNKSLGTVCVILGSTEVSKEDIGLFDVLAREAAVALKTAKEYERTQTLSITDGLTGAYNYRFLIDAVRKEIGRSERFGEDFSLVMIDVDGLKEYNDVHGHLRGSGVIKQLAKVVSRYLRRIDMLCKYGGDEFVVILPRTPKVGAALAAERIRQAIEKHRFPGERLTGKITASMGIATYPEDGKTVQKLINSADKALYRAKRHGRNQIWLSGDTTRYSGN